MKESILKMQRKVKHYLDDYRYQHTLGVMYTAGALAMCHGADLESALIAGLLHDCAKCIPSEEKIRICQRNDIPITAVEMDNPGLLHAKLGAYFAENSYHVTDPDILNAIRYHTTGRPAMGKLEQILYIADYMEPGRKDLPNMNDVRRLAFQDLNACMLRILKDSLDYLKSRQIPLDPMTEQTCQYYTNQYT